MNHSNWLELAASHCTQASSISGEPNPLYESLSSRRYNYAPTKDAQSIRLLFLSPTLKDQRNKTLRRQGRFIWCRNLGYEGLSPDGLRQVSFTIDKGKKRFIVSENNVLCLPAKVFINNSRFLRDKQKLFRGFCSVFGYENTVQMMLKGPQAARYDYEDFLEILAADNPYTPGTLVAPRRGYFYPSAVILPEALEGIFQRYENVQPLGNQGRKIIQDITYHHRVPRNTKHLAMAQKLIDWVRTDAESQHPYGIVLGPSFENNKHTGREFYRVRFGETTYERVHPVEMEIINEV